MTADERTEKLILDIAASRGQNAVITVRAFEEYLSNIGLEIKLNVLAILCARLEAEGSLCNRIAGYAITPHGLQRLETLRKKSADEALAQFASRGNIQIDPEQEKPEAQLSAIKHESAAISEIALDGWWETCDMEIKIELFNSFYEPLTEDAEDGEAA